MLKKISILSLICILSGCGFHLQGKHVFSPVIQNLAIIPGGHNSFQNLLKDSLQNNGINIKDTDIRNVAILEINDPVISEQIQGYDSKGQISQYRLTSSCSYKLFAENGKILLQNTINRSRTYAVTPNRLLSNASQQQIISEELTVEIVNELLRQLSKCC